MHNTGARNLRKPIRLSLLKRHSTLYNSIRFVGEEFKKFQTPWISFPPLAMCPAMRVRFCCRFHFWSAVVIATRTACLRACYHFIPPRLFINPNTSKRKNGETPVSRSLLKTVLIFISAIHCCPDVVLKITRSNYNDIFTVSSRSPTTKRRLAVYRSLCRITLVHENPRCSRNSPSLIVTDRKLVV